MPPVQAPGGNFITHFIASWMENSDATEKRMIDHTLRLHAGCLRTVSYTHLTLPTILLV